MVMVFPGSNVYKIQWFYNFLNVALRDSILRLPVMKGYDVFFFLFLSFFVLIFFFKFDNDSDDGDKTAAERYQFFTANYHG